METIERGTVAGNLETRVEQLGKRLLVEARERKSGFWARERWEEGLLRKLMENEQFRVQALRFVDVLPVLKDDEELVRHVREYFGEEDLPLPGLARWGMEHARGGVAAHLVAGAVRAGIHGLATRFIGGADVKEALRSVEEIRRDGMAFTLDLLGEATVSEAEAGEYHAKYLRLLDDFTPRVARWKPNPLLDTVSGHPSPRLNLSVKISSLYSQLTPVDPEGSAEAVKERLRPIMRSAREKGAFICLDMEQYDTKEIVLRVFREILMEAEFRDWPHAGLAMQAYLRDTEADLHSLIEWVKERGVPVTVRLVRGAYWDYETVVARQNEWPVPVWTEKWETDQSYERCTRLLLESHPHIEAAIATHNVRSLSLAMALADELGLGPDQYELQMLYGMADPLKDAVARMGRRLRVYVPFGELLPGMSYLVRRLLENTASQSFLRMGFAEDLPAEALLAPPAGGQGPGAGGQGVDGNGTGAAVEPPDGRTLPLNAQRPTLNAQPALHPSSFILHPFKNESVRRFTERRERERFAAAIEQVRGELGREYPLLLDGQDTRTGEWIASTNPARPAELVGRVASASPKEAEAAVKSALAAFPGWRDRSAAERSDFLVRAAARLRERRDEFSAWEIFEAGKTWREADADVTEAIDFLEYYAREAVRLSRVLPLNVPGETNAYFYQPRGVGVVIPPWNFPLAILTGMLSASVVTGNTAILKPASQTAVIAAKLMEIVREVGFPEGVINFLPGPGAEVGEYLVRHPQTHFIAFTGSRAVGCRINVLAAEVREGQDHLKRVIAELGGKNAIIIDSDADVDDAVVGTVASAFGYQGQKCSAASRVIVVDGIYEAFVRRLVEAARSLDIGMPEDPGNYMGPVIEAKARDNIRKAIEAGKSVARLALETDVSYLGDGHFIGPTIFTEVPPESPLAQEEIFGPVLAVMRARDFREALDLANGTSYALTGGVYSRSPEHLDWARREFRVGNLYLNRKITGAIVGRQPFGGFKMSGVGSKAGGPDYLVQFLEPRTVTENTLRRGFAPEEDTIAADLGGL
jgi:RHH-type transcriptional regulator, proline utilization regulon repressor / proline dehydrogenase / delta 1-pyrroline-5-carboxylate dehydrogenase